MVVRNLLCMTRLQQSAALNALWSDRQDGAIRYHHLEHDPALLEQKDVLPPPLAADLNGDGRMEVITATHDARLHVRLSPSHRAAPAAVHRPPSNTWHTATAPDAVLPNQVLAPRRPGHAGDGFAKAALLADVSLMPAGPNEAPAGHRAVALATGYLDPKHEELVLALRKQVSCRLGSAWVSRVPPK